MHEKTEKQPSAVVLLHVFCCVLYCELSLFQILCFPSSYGNERHTVHARDQPANGRLSIPRKQPQTFGKRKQYGKPSSIDFGAAAAKSHEGP